jgi:DHA2 family multidrug resistance protein
MQLAVAPLAVALEKRIDARLLSGAGFLLFAIGIAMSAFQNPRTDFDAMFWPQIVRGTAIMFCLLPPTRLALGRLDADRVPDASGLFNLMRNLGGAIGIALIDTVIYTRSDPLADNIWAQLQSGNLETANYVGAPANIIAGHAGVFDTDTRAMLDPLVQTAASAQAINEAWLMIAILTALALLCVPLAKRPV